MRGPGHGPIAAQPHAVCVITVLRAIQSRQGLFSQVGPTQLVLHSAGREITCGVVFFPRCRIISSCTVSEKLKYKRWQTVFHGAKLRKSPGICSQDSFKGEVAFGAAVAATERYNLN